MQGQGEIKKSVTYTYPNMIVNVHRPDLTEEEKERRMTSVKEAVIKMFKN